MNLTVGTRQMKWESSMEHGVNLSQVWWGGEARVLSLKDLHHSILRLDLRFTAAMIGPTTAEEPTGPCLLPPWNV